MLASLFVHAKCEKMKSGRFLDPILLLLFWGALFVRTRKTWCGNMASQVSRNLTKNYQTRAKHKGYDMIWWHHRFAGIWLKTTKIEPSPKGESKEMDLRANISEFWIEMLQRLNKCWDGIQKIDSSRSFHFRTLDTTASLNFE